MIETRKCHSLVVLLSAVGDATALWGVTPWARGQEDAQWKLMPSVWREFGHRPLAEMNAFLQFQNQAIGVRSNCPARNDSFGWLMLMQHFGLPTRLLDWTQSLSVASYFCVFNEKFFDRDGAIWLLDPVRLNGHHEKRKTPTVALADDPIVSNLADGAMAAGDFLPEVQAVLPPVSNERIARQSGTFTIHGSPTPLEDGVNWSRHIFKIIIPAKAKPIIAEALSTLGVSRQKLFPDIETLSMVTKESIKRGIELGYWGDEVTVQPDNATDRAMPDR